MVFTNKDADRLRAANPRRPPFRVLILSYDYVAKLQAQLEAMRLQLVGLLHVVPGRPARSTPALPNPPRHQHTKMQNTQAPSLPALPVCPPALSLRP